MTEDMKNQTVSEDDLSFMRRALVLAEEAAEKDEVPIGCVIVYDGKIIAEASNSREIDKSATHHAEILAIERACAALGGWRLPNTTLYVTLEPCPMCAGAVIHARIPRVVFGAYDKRFGALGSLTDLSVMEFNHKPSVTGGVMEEECRTVLTEYFRKKRQK